MSSLGSGLSPWRFMPVTAPMGGSASWEQWQKLALNDDLKTKRRGTLLSDLSAGKGGSD